MRRLGTAWPPLGARARIEARIARRDLVVIQGALQDRRTEDEAHTGRPRPRVGLGGPTLLTEDRQKPRHPLDGMHGTRNTVPSIAVGDFKPCLPLRSSTLTRVRIGGAHSLAVAPG